MGSADCAEALRLRHVSRAGDRLGVRSSAPAADPTDKAIVEATLASINAVLSAHRVPTPARTRPSRVDATSAFTVPELQDLLDEWRLAGWPPRPHDPLRAPPAGAGAVAEREDAALVAAAGYLPLTS